jgi:hypothetical protein
MLSRLITGLDGRSISNETAVHRIPSSSLPSPTFTIFAPAHNPSGFIGYAAVPRDAPATIMPEKPVPMIATRKARVRSGSSRAPSPMEKALPRCEHNFVREQTDDDDDKHDADNLVHRI